MRFKYKIYYSDRYRNQIVSCDPDTGKTEIEARSLKDPYGIAVDNMGEIVASDKNNHRIVRLKKGNLEKIRTYDPDGHRKKHALKYRDNPESPAGLFYEKKESLLVCYSDDHTIYRVHKDGKLELVLGIPYARDYGFAGAAQEVKEVKNTPIHIPTAVVAQKDGTIFFIERGYQTVRKYEPQKGFHSIFPLDLSTKFQNIKDVPLKTNMDSYCAVFPTALAIEENTLFLADGQHRCVYEIDIKSKEMTLVMKTGQEAKKYGPGPVAIAMGQDKTLWVLDIAGNCLQGFQKTQEKHWKKVDVEFSFPQSENLCGMGGTGMVCA